MTTAQPYLVTPTQAKAIERTVRRVENTRGSGVRVTEDALEINTNATGPSRAGVQTLDTGFWATLASPSQDSTNKRWSYTFTEVELTADSYTGWSAKTGGRTGTCRNTLEVGNSSTGLYGNGVTSTNLTGTYALQSIPSGRPLWVRQVVTTDGTVTYWVQYASGVDGACP